MTSKACSKGRHSVVIVHPKKWTFPPFSATRDGGYVYNRGSLDAADFEDRPKGFGAHSGQERILDRIFVRSDA